MSDTVSPQNSEVYRFGGFLLDVGEKALTRDGQPVPLAPKAFLTLTVLVENAGHLLQKDYLMDRIWEGHFVEQSNLTFNIRTLRKALGDNASKPEFVETVPRHGYRFIAKVERVLPDVLIESKTADDEIRKHVGNPGNRAVFLATSISAVVLLAVLAGIVASAYSWRNTRRDEIPLLSDSFNIQPITATGGVRHAVISPDGKYVVYLEMKAKNGIVWLRETATGGSRQIIPPTEDLYAGFAISPDSRFLFFGRVSRYSGSQADIYKMPLFGGPPVKVVSEAQGWISLSPDGKMIAFVRCLYREAENCSLWVADASAGSNEKKLAVRTKPFRISGIAFSPDGRKIAFANGQSNDQSDDFKLSQINLETGEENDISSERYFNIAGLAWLPYGDSLLITASQMPNRHYFLRRLKVGGGSEIFSNTLLDPANLSVDREAKYLIATNVRSDFDLNLVPFDGGRRVVLTNAVNATFAADGRILFASGKSGEDAIWSMESDGRDQRQLTNLKYWEGNPIGGPDGNTVYFASNRSGAVHVWRMNSDGSDQRQVTNKNGGFPVFVDSENNWLYFHHNITRDLWRVSLTSGEDLQVIRTGSHRFVISEDGKRVAFTVGGRKPNVMRIASLPNGETLREFGLPGKHHLIIEVGWLPDNNELALISADADFEGNVLWVCSAEGTGFRRIADLGDDRIYEGSGLGVSPDGRQVVFAQGNWKHDAVLISGLGK